MKMTLTFKIEMVTRVSPWILQMERRLASSPTNPTPPPQPPPPPPSCILPANHS